MIVDDLSPGRDDPMNSKVTEIFGKNPPIYGVYAAGEKVRVFYADDRATADAQRKALAPLAGLRDEIVGLIDGWCHATRSKSLQLKAKHYNGRVAAALVGALEGDVERAGDRLAAIRDSILGERVTAARYWYLVVAAMCAAAFYGIASLVTWPAPGSTPSTVPVYDQIWIAAKMGAMGAFFSMTLAIRNRTVLPDIQWIGNAVDAVVRIVIGIISGGVLMALLAAKTVIVSFGSAVLGATDPPWLYVILAGFLAGFVERLVPDMLDKGRIAEAPKPAPLPPEGISSTTPQDIAHGEAAAADLGADDDDVDGCCDHSAVSDDSELTSDAQLPEASGGVARPDQQ